MKKVKQLLPEASGYAVQYPADMSRTSESKGAADVASRLKTQTAKCPNKKFALVGYSQGSRTVRKGLDAISKEGGDVKNRVWKAVVAVVTYGDAGYRASENATRPSPPMPEEMRNKGIVVTNCAKKDPVSCIFRSLRRLVGICVR
jgi:cutinase